LINSSFGQESVKNVEQEVKPFYVISPKMDKFGTSKSWGAPLIPPSELKFPSEEALSIYPDWFTEEDIRKDIERKDGFEAYMKDLEQEDLFGDSFSFLPPIDSSVLADFYDPVEKDWSDDCDRSSDISSFFEPFVDNVDQVLDVPVGLNFPVENDWLDSFDERIECFTSLGPSTVDVEDSIFGSVEFTSVDSEVNCIYQDGNRGLGEIFGDVIQEFHLPGGSHVKKKKDSFDRLFFDSDVVNNTPSDNSVVGGSFPSREHEIMRTLMWRDGISLEGDPERDVPVKNWSIGSFPYYCSKISAPPDLETELDRYMSRYDRAKVLLYTYNGSYLNRTSSYVQLMTWVSPVMYSNDSLTRKDLCQITGWGPYKVYDIGPNSEIEFKGSFNPSGFYPITIDDSCFWKSSSVSIPLRVYLNFALIGFHKWPSDIGLCMFESLHLMKFKGSICLEDGIT